MIIEERLKDLFETLPSVESNGIQYPIQYDFGTEEDLMRFLKVKANAEGNIFPLIWLQTPNEMRGNNFREVDLKLIIATQSNREMWNKQRLDVTIKPILKPLLDNIIFALMRSGFTRFNDREKNVETIFYNYGLDEDEISPEVAIWDAIKFEASVIFSHGSLKSINY